MQQGRDLGDLIEFAQRRNSWAERLRTHRRLMLSQSSCAAVPLTAGSIIPRS